MSRMNLSMPIGAERQQAKGIVFDVQAYSVHDGPGCRTLFFLSGCPLKCAWCANPEGWKVRQRLMYAEQKCKYEAFNCERCIERCPRNAIHINNQNKVVINRDICSGCNTYECAEACRDEAIRVSGKEFTLDDFIHIVCRDRQFWSGNGGVTFTGGEPMVQKDFLLAALKYCKEAYIHTAIETCGCVPSETFRTIIPYIDFMFMDLKNMDNEKHIEETGMSNKQVLDNITIAAGPEFKGRLIIRKPVIPGFNHNMKDMIKTADFMASLNLKEINLLPFHRMGDSKWTQLGVVYPFTELESMDPTELIPYISVFEERGIHCYIGSNTPF